MRKNWLLLAITLLIAALAIGAVACGDDAPIVIEKPPTDILVDDSNMVIVSAGFLADSDGNTLYVFDDDEDGVSNCIDECTNSWLPFTVDGDPEAGDGVGTVATITRDDGTTQVTHNGQPLYYYSEDSGVGDQSGDGKNGAWHMVPGGE